MGRRWFWRMDSAEGGSEGPTAATEVRSVKGVHVLLIDSDQRSQKLLAE